MFIGKSAVFVNKKQFCLLRSGELKIYDIGNFEVSLALDVKNVDQIFPALHNHILYLKNDKLTMVNS